MNSTMKGFRKIAALALILALTLSAVPFSALAARENTPKEEVVYVNLNADGTVAEIHVVNIFNLSEAGQILDYGDYTQLRNMTSTDVIDYADGVVTIAAQAGKLYYEGKLSGNTIPWNIAISYYMDGREYTAEEVAGMDGALTVRIRITRNEACGSNFFDAFALQLSLTLDSSKCSNIVAPDATVANVGSNKQLTHTILPGGGADLEITADVVNFSMEGISINAIPLNLDVNVDNPELMEKITQLTDAIGNLDDGAASLTEGISALQTGAETDLEEGADLLSKGAKELEEGVAELRNGGNTLHSGAQSVSSGAAELAQGIKTLNNGIVRMQEALNELNSQSATLQKGSSSFLLGMTMLQDVLSSINVTSENLSALTESSAQILTDITELVNGTQNLQKNVSFAALKAAMANNGVNVDQLKQDNLTAMSALRSSIDSNREYTEAMEALGMDATGLFSQMEQAIQLLKTNNAFIDGTGSYLNTMSNQIIPLVEDATQLKTSYALLDADIIELSDTLDSLASRITSLNKAVNSLVTSYQKLDTGINAYTGAVAEIVSAYTDIANGSAMLVSGSTELKKGTSSLYAGTGELLDGITELYQGAGALKNGSAQLDDGVEELLRGISKLYTGSQELKNGTSTMRVETEGMDTIISDTVDKMLADITGRDVEVGSFVSDRNENVDSVQFVIKTAGIQPLSGGEDTPDTDQPLTFWQKLLRLFRF